MGKDQRILNEDYLGEVVRIPELGENEIIVQKDEGKYFKCAIMPNMQTMKILKEVVIEAINNERI